MENPRVTFGTVLSRFDLCIKVYMKINAIFLGLFAVELLCLIIFFSYLMKTAFLALALAIFFLTLFSFFLFRAYYQSFKQDQFEIFIQEWVQALIGQGMDFGQIAEELITLSDQVSGREQIYYSSLERLAFLNSRVYKISFWCHWEDLMKFRELLLKKAIKEYFKCLRLHPIHQEVHTYLAYTYIKLASLYRTFARTLSQEKVFWTLKRVEALEVQFKIASNKAIEELHILKELSPNNPDIDLQLAILYNDLNMTEEETKQYEEIIEKYPQHNEALFQLGSLYFQQGLNAKGLRIYQLLKQRQVDNAEALIEHYGE